MATKPKISYRKLLGVLDILREQANNLSLERLLQTVIQKTTELVGCEGATIFLVNRETSEVYSKQTSEPDLEIRFPYGQGIAGESISQKRIIVSTSPYEDPRFNRDIDKTTGFVTKNILCVPLLNQVGEAIGCLQAINKAQNNFADSDISLMEIIAKISANEIEFAMTALQKKIADIGQMTSGLIHDFKGPLTIISGATHYLKKDDVSYEKRIKYTNMIDEQIARCVCMIKDVLNYVNGDKSISRADILITDFVSTLKENLTPIILGENIEITFDIQTSPDALIYIDIQKMMRVFQNLVNNSIEAMKENGSIHILFKKTDDLYEVLVEDTGPGIPAQQRNVAFQPFQTFGKAEGTGLGLALVAEFCKLNDIKIALDSSYTNGARFVMHIPSITEAKIAA